MSTIYAGERQGGTGKRAQIMLDPRRLEGRTTRQEAYKDVLPVTPPKDES